MVGVEQPIELSAPPTHGHNEPRVQRMQYSFESDDGARAQPSMFEPRDDRGAAPGPATELGLRPFAPVPKRADDPADPIAAHRLIIPSDALPIDYRRLTIGR